MDEGSSGHRFRIAEEQATSDGDLEALDAAPVWRYHSGPHEEICEDYGTEHAVLEDANSEQTHLGDQDADRMGLETPTTHQESIEPTAAEYNSSSWMKLIRESGDAQRDPETTPKQKSTRSPATDFDRALGAIMMEESDGSPMEHELVSEREWPVRHGWFPQRCQITLDVALSKDSDAKEEVAACEPDRLLADPTLDNVALTESDAKEEVAVREPDRLLAVPTLVALSNKLHAKKAVAASGLDSPLAAPTLDDIALPKLPTTKEVAAYEPDRLRLIVAPRELDRLMAF